MRDVAVVTHRDACEQGFELAPALRAGTADAVMLDLPSPELAVAHATRVLRAGGMLCSFSPCIEQVQRTCDRLRAAGYVEVYTVECLQRPFYVQRHEARPYPGLPVSAVSAVSAVPAVPAAPLAVDDDVAAADATPGSAVSGQPPRAFAVRPPPSAERMARPESEMRGHTSFLTFARRGADKQPEPAEPAASAAAAAAAAAVNGATGGEPVPVESVSAMDTQ